MESPTSPVIKPVHDDFYRQIAEAIAEIRTKDDLAFFLKRQVHPTFQCEDSAIFYADGDDTGFLNYLYDSSEQTATSFRRFVVSEQVEYASQLPHSSKGGEAGSRVGNRWLIDDKTNPDGYVHTFALKEGERSIGVWVCLLSEKVLSDACMQKLTFTSNQLLRIILRLKLEDELAQREEETEIRQSLNTDFTSIKDRRNLLNTIHHKLQRLFNFGHQWVAVINDDQLTITSFLLEARSGAKEHPRYQEIIRSKQPINDNFFNKVLLSKDSCVFDIRQIARRQALPEYMQVLHESGVNKIAMTGLHVGTRTIGIWAICLLNDQLLTDHQLKLVKGISTQLSIAVDNIIVNERIKAKETERELLLNLSYNISNVRTRGDLVRVINNNVRKLFPFENINILLLDEDTGRCTYILASPVPTTLKPPGPDELADPEQVARIHKGFDMMLNSDGILLLDMDYIITTETCTPYLKYEHAFGIKEKVTLPLRDDDRVLGVLCINSKEKGAYSETTLGLICGVSYQISTAVANIIANEEIKNREKEKSRLLAFSNAIVSVRDKAKLAKILKQQLKELLDINEYVIHALNADKTKHTPILFDPDADFPKHPDFKKLIGVETDIHDGIFDTILSSDEPVFFRIDDWTKLPNETAYAKAANAEGVKTMIGAAIKYGSENIAVINFKHDDHTKILQNQHLFKSLVSQIAIMVSNIIANDQLNRQFADINNYKLLLEEEKTYLKEEIEIVHNYSEIVGESAPMQKVFRLMAQVAHSDSTVLLLGETGTGKELVARAIHNNSPRKNKLMVKVNCAALPANLIESELFGHERGSFTGATERRLGKFELANGGTLFLDEIGEMPTDLQVKLLRALQEREIERIGGKGVIKVDVRIIAATNRDLEKEIREGRFRMDLYYRLNIFPITLPSLRERKEDIPLLTAHFISRFGKKAGRRIKTIGTKALQDMLIYNWPGNIREMEHLLERSILLSEGDTLKQVHLPAPKMSDVKTEAAVFQVRTIDENERQHIMDMLTYCQGRVGGYGGAAELLAVPASTLFSKMKKLGIKRGLISDNLS